MVKKIGILDSKSKELNRQYRINKEKLALLKENEEIEKDFLALATERQELMAALYEIEKRIKKEQKKAEIDAKEEAKAVE